MACVHNQAKINELETLITEKETQVSKLRNNINKCVEIADKHLNFRDDIGCVINNLEGNNVVAGRTYDQGKMTECLEKVNETLTDCNIIIKESEEKINLLVTEISNLRTAIKSLQGDCYACSIKTKKNRKE